MSESPVTRYTQSGPRPLSSFHRGNPAANTEGENHETHPVVRCCRALVRRRGGGAYAQGNTEPVINNKVTTNQASLPAIEVPTVVVTITQALPLTLASQATYQLYNGGNAVSMDSAGDLTVNAPTDIRIVIKGANGTAYDPVGVSFRQIGTADPNGAISFQTQNVTNQVLVIHDDDRVSDTTYFYRLVFASSDGQLHTLGR